MKLKNCIKSVAFILVFVLLFSCVSRVVTVSSEDTEYLWMTGIYEEPDNSLDGVYIGSSNCFAYWNSNVAWNEYGITVYPYACSSQPLIVTEYLIKEVRKTQPNAFFIVNINTLGEYVRDIVMHRLLDFMPLSKNKLELTDYLCDLNNLSFEERLEYYFPIFRYHEKWTMLDSSNFTSAKERLKGANTFTWHLGTVKDFSKNYITSDGYADITQELEKSLNSLLDYCDTEKLQIVFVTVPRNESKKEDIEKFNMVNKIISERGYPVIDILNNPEEANIDASVDFYNKKHTNIHGALKVTHYISNYVIENFDIDTEHSEEITQSWNESYEKYSEILSHYVLDIELTDDNRDFSLDMAKDISVSYQFGNVGVSWESISGADGYAVYKKSENGSWGLIGNTESLSFTDNDVENEKSYYYTVVPYSIKNGEKMYGNYLYNGIEISVEK